MKFSILRIVVLTTLLASGLSNYASAEHGHCAHCGCACECEQVCRLVREDKKVPVTCWGYKCEDFCLPGPSERGCLNEDYVCDPCNDMDPKAPCHQAKPFVWFDWFPSCSSHVYTRKRLMKKTVTKTIPGYKWVVEDVCSHCQGKYTSVPLEPGAKLPSLPSDSPYKLAPISANGK